MTCGHLLTGLEASVGICPACEAARVDPFHADPPPWRGDAVVAIDDVIDPSAMTPEQRAAAVEWWKRNKR